MLVPESPLGSPIFLFGAVRSGTTLLSELLDAHPHIAVFCESYLPRVAWTLSDVEMTDDRRAGALATFLFDTFNPYGNGTNPILGFLADPELRLRLLAAPRRLGSWLTVLLDAWRRHQGAVLWADKSTPSQAGEILTMLDLFPTARFVHIYRDPRAVARSLLAAGWAGSAAGAAAIWSVAIREIEDGHTVVPAHQKWRTSYEALTSDPRRELQGLCRFIRVPFTETMLAHPRSVNPTRANISVPAIRAGVGEPVRPDEGRWRNHLSMRQIHLVEATNRHRMARYGYEPESSSRYWDPAPAITAYRHVRGRRRAVAARYDQLRHHVLSAFD